MDDRHTELLMNIQKELTTNTTQTIGINQRLDILNGKVASHSKEISRITIALIVVGCIVGTLLITNGSEFVDFVLKII